MARRRGGRRASACLAVAILLVISPPVRADVRAEGEGPALTDAGITSVWRTLRAVDCARCHGKDYEGLAAPSIIEYARTQSREMFVRMVLDGDPARGMPAYRSNPWIAEHINDVYRYFLGRADGTIHAGPQPQSR